MTKAGWDQNDALTRDDLEFIGEVGNDGQLASTNPTHSINIPNDRLGYHVILAVWDVADTKKMGSIMSLMSMLKVKQF